MAGLTIFFRIFILFITVPAYAQPLERHSPCLDEVFELQSKFFNANHKYIVKVDHLKKELSPACKKFRYEITSRVPNEYKVAMEWHDEVWTVNEQADILRVIGPKPATSTSAAATPSASPKPASVSAAYVALPPGARPNPHEPQMQAKVITEPLKVLPVVKPRAATVNDGAHPPAVATLAKPLAPPQDTFFIPQIQAFVTTLTPAEKLESCYTHSKFRDKECTDMFADLDTRCTAEAKPSALCESYLKTVTNPSLEVCEQGEANYGKCELRRRRLAKKCDNPLAAQLSSDCQMLNVYLASYVPDIATMPTSAIATVAHRAPAMSCGRGDRQLCVADYCGKASNAGATREDITRCAEAQGTQSGRASTRYMDNANTMQSSLQIVSHLRPVVYQWKDSHLADLGFVAEEVQSVDPMLVTYTEQGQIQGVKYGQMSALLTSAMQELYGRCEQTAGKEENLVKRLELVEGVNTELLHENTILKKQLEKQAKDLEKIKIKMGLN